MNFNPNLFNIIKMNKIFNLILIYIYKLKILIINLIILYLDLFICIFFLLKFISIK